MLWSSVSVRIVTDIYWVCSESYFLNCTVRCAYIAEIVLVFESGVGTEYKVIHLR